MNGRKVKLQHPRFPGIEVTEQTLMIPGTSFRVFYGPENQNNALWHTRASVDGDRVVIRKWCRGRWEYCLRDTFWLTLLLKDSFIKEVRHHAPVSQIA
jgi:hypothetical protein